MWIKVFFELSGQGHKNLKVAKDLINQTGIAFCQMFVNQQLISE